MRTLLLTMMVTFFTQSSFAAIHCLFEKTAKSPRELIALNNDKTMTVKTQSGSYGEGRWMKQPKNPTMAAQMHKTYSQQPMNAQERADFNFLVNGMAKSGYIIASEGPAPHFLVATKTKSVKMDLARGAIASGRCQVKTNKK